MIIVGIQVRVKALVGFWIMARFWVRLRGRNRVRVKPSG